MSNNNKKVVKVRYKEDGGPKTKLLLTGKHKGINPRGRRVVSVRKVSYEEMLSASTPGGVGSFFKPDKLMQELKELRVEEAIV